MTNNNPMTAHTVPDLRSIDIHELLPQQEPFVMVGRLAHVDETSCTTETDITERNIFVEDGFLSASGLIENVAQSCAARLGYYNKYILRRGIQVGFIGAVSHLEITALPRVGDTISTTVEVVGEVFGTVLASARVCHGEELLMTTQIKIAIKEEETPRDTET